MAKKHTKWCSTVIHQKGIANSKQQRYHYTTIPLYHYTTIQQPKFKTLTVPCAGEDEELWDHSFIVGGNPKWDNYFGRPFGSSYMGLPYDSAIALWYFLKWVENVCTHKNMYTECLQQLYS